MSGGLREILTDRPRFPADHPAHVEQTGVLTEPVTWSGEFAVPSDTQVLANSTSIALAPNVDDVVPIDYGTLAASTLVCDVIRPAPPGDGRTCVNAAKLKALGAAEW